MLGSGKMEQASLSGWIMKLVTFLLQLPLISAGATPIVVAPTPLELGDPAPSNAVRKEGRSILVSPAQFEPLWYWHDRGVDYTLGVDDDGRVEFISTGSPLVRTVEGVTVGLSVENLRAIDGVRIYEWNGWGFVAALPSGWNAALFLNGQFLDREPRPDDTVDLLFKGSSAGYGH